MQDNASIDSAKITKYWFAESGICTIERPLYSPDLNPIEHAWVWLKEMSDRIDSNLEQFAGTTIELFTYFSKLMEQAWVEVGQDYFDRLVSTIVELRQ